MHFSYLVSLSPRLQDQLPRVLHQLQTIDSLEPVFGNSFLGSDVVDVVSGLVSSVVLSEGVSSLDLPGVVSTVVVVVVDSSVVCSSCWLYCRCGC